MDRMLLQPLSALIKTIVVEFNEADGPGAVSE